MFEAETLLGARTSANTAAASGAVLLDANGLIVSSATTSTSFGAATPTDAIGLIGTDQKFRAITVSASPQGFAPLVALRVLARIPWTLTAQSLGVPQGRLRVELWVDGVLKATANGAIRSLSAANGTKYTEIVELLVPVADGQAFPLGTQVELRIRPEVTIASGTPASTCELTLRHDPQVIDDQLVAEFCGAADVL